MDKKLYKKEIIAFIKAANEYCKLVENVKQFSKKELMQKIQALLPELYSKALKLPAREPIYEDGNEKFVNENDWQKIYNHVCSKLGHHDTYLEVFDPKMHESEGPVTSSIAEDLADIYQDVKDFLLLYEIGTHEIMNDALWECKENFNRFWGQKLVNALRAIHMVITTTDNLDDDQDGSPDIKNEKPVNTDNWIITKRQQEYRDEK